MEGQLLIDCDVHHRWKRQHEMTDYLPTAWRDEYIRAQGTETELSILMPAHHNPHSRGSQKRLDTFPGDGTEPGSDYPLMREQLLDRLGVTRAILGFDIGLEAKPLNPNFALPIARAMNDWSIDHWLSGDSRLLGAIVVPTEMPSDAAAEIRRLAGHPRLVHALVVANGIGKPLGHPLYHPIYEAAAECGIPIAIHAGTDVVPGGQMTASGIPMSRLEHFPLMIQPIFHHLSSMITHGVFEKFPTLRLMVIEHGFTWVPGLLWKLDAHFPIMRRENPIVRRLPSEVFREHIRFTTQPFDFVRKEQMVQLLESFDGMEDMICFSSDYPHWDADEPAHVISRLPSAWATKLFFGNACTFYGWDPADLVVST